MSTPRDELKLRREKLRTRLARERMLFDLKELLSQLDHRAADYHLQWDEDADIIPNTWIEQLFPIASYGRIDWSKVPTSKCQRWETEQERNTLVSQALAISASDPESYITVIWLANKPAICMQVVDAQACLAEILDADWDTWIYSPTDFWLIENYHEGEVCVGHSPQEAPTKPD